MTAQRWVYAALAAALLATVAGLALLWPRDLPTRVDEGSRVPATVIDLVPCDVALPGADEGTLGSGPECRAAVVRVDGGVDTGVEVVLPAPAGAGAPTLQAGDRIVLLATLAGADRPATERYAVVDFQRQLPLTALAATFAVAVVALAGWRGVRALVGLAASLGVLLVFVVPALLVGQDPLAVAVVGAAAIAFLTLPLTHGLTPVTSVALLGSLVALALTAVLGAAVTAATRLTGLANESAALLVGLNEVEPRGLLLAGLVIGALGVLDDVTVTQAATVRELASALPDAPRRTVFGSAMTVGRDHVAATVNTLALAYAGAALPLLLLFVLAGTGFGSVVTGELVATEVVRALVGGLGIVAAVPLTTGLAVAVLSTPATAEGHGAMVR